MNKLLATLLAGAFALTLGSSAFAADAAKTVEAVKATTTKAVDVKKVEAAKVETPADATAKPAKKHHHKHEAKKAADSAAPAVEATPAAK